MKAIKIRYPVILPALVFLLSGLFAAETALARDEFSQDYETEPGGLLELDMESGGSVEIEGWDKELLQITYYDRTVDLEDWDVEIQKTRHGYCISAELNDRRIQSSSLRFEIMVPRRYDVEFDSIGGGFAATGIEGEFSGRTAGGGISFEDVRGEVRMTTGGGRIEVLDSTLDGKISTGGGGALIKNVVGDLRASSGGGNVEYVNVRDHDGELVGPGSTQVDGMTEDTVMITTAGGGIRIKKAPAGAYLTTGGGEIDVRHAEDFVIASTGGGDIEITVENGYVQASTGAGDIEAEIVGGSGDLDEPSHISSGYGDITVTIPKDFSIDLNIDLRYTRNSDRDFEIITDLDIVEERTKKWDHSFGSPIKHIYGSARLNGGRHEVTIETTNGNIRIREK